MIVTAVCWPLENDDSLFEPDRRSLVRQVGLVWNKSCQPSVGGHFNKEDKRDGYR
jgi:hypothetical protein